MIQSPPKFTFDKGYTTIEQINIRRFVIAFNKELDAIINPTLQDLDDEVQVCKVRNYLQKRLSSLMAHSLVTSYSFRFDKKKLGIQLRFGKEIVAFVRDYNARTGI